MCSIKQLLVTPNICVPVIEEVLGRDLKEGFWKGLGKERESEKRYNPISNKMYLLKEKKYIL